MYRPKIENLEKRLLFAADILSDVVTPDEFGDCSNWSVDPSPPPFVGEMHNGVAGDPAAMVDFIDADATSTPSSLAKMHLEDISLGIKQSYPATDDLWQVSSRTGTADGIVTDLNDPDALGASFTAVPEMDANANSAGEDDTTAESVSLNFTKIDGVVAPVPETEDVYHLSDRPIADINDIYAATSPGTLDANNTIPFDAWGFSWGNHQTGWRESQPADSLVGDFNGDGRDDLAAFASDNMVGRLLPHFEQDNSFSDTVFDDQAAAVSAGVTGGGAESIYAATKSAHAAAFAELVSSDGDSQWADPRQQQIIAILIGLVANRSETTASESLDASRTDELTDGTSNTLLLSKYAGMGFLKVPDIPGPSERG